MGHRRVIITLETGDIYSKFTPPHRLRWLVPARRQVEFPTALQRDAIRQLQEYNRLPARRPKNFGGFSLIRNRWTSVRAAPFPLLFTRW